MPPKGSGAMRRPGGPRLWVRYAVLLGHVLGELRKIRGLTQNALASALGTNQATWSRYERGAGEIPATLLAQAAVQLGETPLSIATQVDRRIQALTQRGVAVQFTRLGIDGANAGSVGPDELKALRALKLID